MLVYNYDTSPIVSMIKSDTSIEIVLDKITKSPTSEINIFCSTTNASLLFYAVQRKHDDEALKLCKLLCDELKICDPLHEDKNKQIALFFAARDGNSKCVQYLIDKGADPNHSDSAQQTSIFYAARDGRIEAMQTLLDAGANINICDHLGQTALFYAARDGREDAVLFMLKNGADIDVKDRNRRTALYYAMRNSYPKIITLLKSWTTNNDMKRQRLDVSDSNVDIPDSPLSNVTSSTIQNSQSQPVPRKCYRLAIKGPFNNTKGTDDASSLVWISAPLREIEKFELLHSNIAVWPKNTPTVVTDIFYDLKPIWQPLAISILDDLLNMEGGWVFSKPVDCKVWGCPDYYDVIQNPMDFTTIKKKFKTNSYSRYMDLIFFNCFRYNRPESHVAQIGKSLQENASNLYESKGLKQCVEKEKILEEWYKTLDDQEDLVIKET